MAEVILEDFFGGVEKFFLSLCCLLKDINSILTNYSGFFLFLFCLFLLFIPLPNSLPCSCSNCTLSQCQSSSLTYLGTRLPYSMKVALNIATTDMDGYETKHIRWVKITV